MKHAEEMLTEVSESLHQMIHIMTSSGLMMKASDIRKSEKQLLVIEQNFSKDFLYKTKMWKESFQAIHILEKISQNIDKVNEKLKEKEQELEECSESMQRWMALENEQRLNFAQKAKECCVFLEGDFKRKEAHVIHKYRRYYSFKSLAIWADNADYLCEAVSFYENRNKYEEHLKMLEEKKRLLGVNLKGLGRSQIIAIFSCVFIISIFLCVPFIFSIQTRKKEILKQIANIEEGMRRERKRLELAEEGAIASASIRESLGDVSLEHIRRLLLEVKELRKEFSIGSVSHNSLTVSILSFLYEKKEMVEHLFGSIPEDPVDAIYWYWKNVDYAQNIEEHIVSSRKNMDLLKEEKRKLLKGYNEDILMESISKLKDKMRESEFLIGEIEVKKELSSLAHDGYELCLVVRKALWMLSRAQSICQREWDMLLLQMSAFQNTIDSLKILEECPEDLNVLEGLGEGDEVDVSMCA